MNAKIAACLLLLAGCATPSQPAWLPQVNEEVLCDGHDPSHRMCVTKVVQFDAGGWWVMSNEHPNGVPVGWVSRLEDK